MLSCQAVRALHHPSRAELNLPGVLFALSDPTRLHIVKYLADQGETICAAVGVPLSKSSCSRHFKVLRESGVIRMRPQGAAYLNTLRLTPVMARWVSTAFTMRRKGSRKATRELALSVPDAITGVRIGSESQPYLDDDACGWI